MATEQVGTVCDTSDPATGKRVSDKQLLQRYALRGDEAAFDEIVKRYGPTVWSVCRRLLRQEQDAEDAFQAVFFILARKATSIHKREALGSWLYGVAYRTALKAMRHAARRHSREQHMPGSMPEHQPWSQAASRELQRLLDEEVQALPDKYRRPFVLCCLEGMSRREAAQELGWKEGTLSGRLAQARQRLEKRLLRRGVTLSAVLTVGVLAQNVAWAAPPILLVQSTSAAVLAPLTGTVTLNTMSPAATSLANAVMPGLTMAKFKAGIMLLLLILAPAASAVTTAVIFEAQQVDVAAPGDANPAALNIDEQVLALDFSADGKKLVTAGARQLQPGQLKTWDVATKENLLWVRGFRGIRSLACAPQGDTVATGHFDGEIILRDLIKGDVRARARGHTIGINGLAFSKDGTLLASAGLDRVVKLWEVEGLKEKQAFHGHTAMVFSVAFSRQGGFIASGGEDKTVRIWDLSTGKERFTLRGHRSAIEMVAISPDDKSVVSASWDGTIRFWDPDTGKQTAALTGNEGSVLAIAFSPDGKLLASAVQNVVRLWDVQKRRRLVDFGRHFEVVWTLSFSRDGKLLASGSSDRTAKLWDVAGRKEIATLMTGAADIPLAGKGAPLVLEDPLAVKGAPPAVPKVIVVPQDETLDAPTEPNTKSGLVTLIWVIPLLILLPAAALLVLVRRKQTPAVPEQACKTADAIRFSCAGCGKQLKAKPELAGKSVRCPHCSKPITIPSAKQEQTAASSTTIAKSAPLMPARNRRSMRWRIVGTLVLVTLVAGAGMVLWSNKPVRVPMVNVVVGCEYVPEVEESGLYGQLYDQKGKPYRWTNGDAKLSILINPRDPPSALRVHVSPWRPPQFPPPSLRLLANERELFHGQIGPDSWERILDLSGIDLGNQVELQIVSDTFVPGQARNALGVQVRGVELLGAAEVKEWASRFLGCKHVPGVQETGFYGQGYTQDGQPFRWTDGNAKLVIPVAPGRRLEGLELQLFPWRPAKAPPASLQIAVNGRERFNGRVPRQLWQQRFDLSGGRAGEALTVSIVSDTFSPGRFDGGADKREHGVEVRSVKLIYHNDDMSK